MIKKVILAILILVILISLIIIGYMITSGGQVNLVRFWPFGGSSNQPITPPTFPIPPEEPITGTSTATSTALIPITIIGNEGTGTATSSIIYTTSATTTIIDNSGLSLTETNAIGLSFINDGKNDWVLFIDRPSGNIYSIEGNDVLKRLTYTTITGVGNAYWGRDKAGWHVLMGYIDNRNVNFYWGLFNSSTTTEAVSLINEVAKGKIVAAASSPDKQRIFTLEEGGGVATGYISNWNDGTKKKIWSVPVSNWIASWPKAEIISLNTKPSANINGSLFFLNPTTGSLTSILSDIPGLESLVGSNGNFVVFSRSYGTKLSFYSLDIKNNKTVSLGLNTLPEKCVWADNENIYCAVPKSIPSALYPDDWYKSKITFNDDIWKINLTDKSTKMVVPLQGSYDLVNLVFSQKRNTLYAINKIDNSIKSLILPLN